MKFHYSQLLLLLSLSTQSLAQDFSQPITVTTAKPGVFHHFESSGRTSIAVANETVGIVWEDNRSGTPQIYVAFKHKTAQTFSAPVQISPTGPAYEPAITSINNSFIIGWEARDQIWLRTVSPAHLGKVIPLSPGVARQITFASTSQNHAIAAWSEHDAKSYHIRIAELTLKNDALMVNNNRPVDTSANRKEQLYPSVAITRQGTVVGWEDRRQGATRIFTAFAPTGKAFEPYQLLNDFRYSRIRKFGSGTGAMRVVLRSDQKSRVMAVWLDKRDFEQGYDVYSAYSDNGGRTFGKDQKVQDPLGDNTPQWHPAVAMSPDGKIVAAWDDTRDGTPDIWFSVHEDHQWSDDETWPGSAGVGSQTLPALLFAENKLHVAWLVRHNNLSSILYSQQ